MLGRILREWREDRGYSRRELAARAGVSEKAVENLERGMTQNPSFQTVVRLCGALDVPLDELVEEWEASGS